MWSLFLCSSNYHSNLIAIVIIEINIRYSSRSDLTITILIEQVNSRNLIVNCRNITNKLVNY